MPSFFLSDNFDFQQTYFRCFRCSSGRIRQSALIEDGPPPCPAGSAREGKWSQGHADNIDKQRDSFNIPGSALNDTNVIGHRIAGEFRVPEFEDNIRHFAALVETRLSVLAGLFRVSYYG